MYKINTIYKIKGYRHWTPPNWKLPYLSEGKYPTGASQSPQPLKCLQGISEPSRGTWSPGAEPQHPGKEEGLSYVVEEPRKGRSLKKAPKILGKNVLTILGFLLSCPSTR